MSGERYLRLRELLRSFRDGQEGQGITEYAFVLILLSIVAIVIVTVIGTQVQNNYSNVANHYPR